MVKRLLDAAQEQNYVQNIRDLGDSIALILLSQRENFRFSWLPDFVLLKRLNFSCRGGWRTEFLRSQSTGYWAS